MSIPDTIAAFEAAKRKKEQEALDLKSAERAAQYTDRIRRAGNAKKVETHLREIVLPELHKAQEEIRASNYGCGVETVSLSDPQFEGKEPTFAIRLRLETSNRQTKGDAVLEYEGQFESVTIRKHETIPTDAAEQPIEIVDLDNSDDGFRSLNQFTAQVVARQVEEFVTAVFRPTL